MNSWSFSGNLGKDCITRFTAKGEPVTSFSVGVASGYGDNKKTTWANCAIWGKRGETLAQYLLKGQLVGVTGEVTLREYTSKEGKTSAALDVRVNDVTLLGSKSESSSAQRQDAPANKPNDANDFSDIPDDIDF